MDGPLCKGLYAVLILFQSFVSVSLRYRVCQFSGKTNIFYFFGPNLPKNLFWGRNFKNLSPDSESAPPRNHVCQFSVKTDNFGFFDLNLGILPNYMQYFGSNNVESVAESLVEVEMSWVEMDGAGWRWMHSLAISIFKGYSYETTFRV